MQQRYMQHQQMPPYSQNRMQMHHNPQQRSLRPNMHQNLNQNYQQRQQQPLQHMNMSSNHSVAKWHIPQQMENGQQQGYGANRPPPALLTPDDSYKITLKPQKTMESLTENKTAGTVTSTIPKTPSPSLGKSKLIKIFQILYLNFIHHCIFPFTSI